MESKNLKLGKKGYLLSQYVSQVDENTNFKETAEYAKILRSIFLLTKISDMLIIKKEIKLQL